MPDITGATVTEILVTDHTRRTIIRTDLEAVLLRCWAQYENYHDVIGEVMERLGFDTDTDGT